MWARHLEVMLGLWMALSPFVFRHPADRAELWVHDLVVAAILVTVPPLAYRPSLRQVHLSLLVLAGWLVGLGWWRAGDVESPAAAQNWIVIGLLLAMFAIVPTEASRPPAWRRRPAPRARTNPGAHLSRRT